MGDKGKPVKTVSVNHPSLIPSWVFGSLFTLFILGVFVFAPATLPEFKQKLLAYLCALLAGFFAFFFTGTLTVKVTGGQMGRNQFVVQAAGGLGAFALTLWWWTGGAAPVKPADEMLKQAPASIVSNPVQPNAAQSGGLADDSSSRNRGSTPVDSKKASSAGSAERGSADTKVSGGPTPVKSAEKVAISTTETSERREGATP
jgi:hypothetical protein